MPHRASFEASSLRRVALVIFVVAAVLAVVLGVLRARALFVLAEPAAITVVGVDEEPASRGSTGRAYRIRGVLADGRAVAFGSSRSIAAGSVATRPVIDATGKVVQPEFVYWIPTILPAGFAVLAGVMALCLRGPEQGEGPATAAGPVAGSGPGTPV